jgi:signal transduction histidine kinase
MAPPSDDSLHPSRYRWSILTAALVAIAVWWGLGLPYSLSVWLLDAQQLKWTLICYAWEVPVAGFLGPVLFPQLWWREVERRWDRVFADPARVDPVEAAALEGAILDYPIRAAWVLIVTTLVGYGVGAVQLHFFAQLPPAQLVNVCLLGVVTGLLGALFAYLYLEQLLAPLLRRLGAARPTAPPGGRPVPLHRKVFACSLVLVFAVIPLLGTVFWNNGARVLEEEIGRRLVAGARGVAAEIAAREAAGGDLDWDAYAARLQLGPSGRILVVDAGGEVVAPAGKAGRLDAEGFRPLGVRRILREPEGHLVDRAGIDRVVAFARLGPDAPGAGAGERRLVAIAFRHDFEDQLMSGLRKAVAVAVFGLLLALGGGFLFSRRLTRPIEILTRLADRIARGPSAPWERVPVRTNDEVGQLAVAFNQMTARLAEAQGELVRHSAELESRVREATRSIATLYDVTRTTTSTLELDDVLELVAEKILAALGLDRLVLLRYPPQPEGAADAYATAAGERGARFEIDAADLAALRAAASDPAVTALAELAPVLPPAVAARLGGGPDGLALPLVFKDEPLGVVLASFDRGRGPLDLELAATLAGQAVVALANAGLFETVRRHETELRELSEMRVRVQEETLRGLSRELHDGLGQVLTAIKIDLGMIEQMRSPDPAALRARVREVRAQVAGLIGEVRRISQLLRPSILDDLGLVPSLRSLVEQFTVRTGIAVDMRLPEGESRFPGPIEALLYRVTQEALTNILKHAQAGRVSLELAMRGGEATLAIADDGVGFELDRLRRAGAVGGLGLLGMRERVAYYGGRIDIRSRPRHGVRIVVAIPVEGEAAGAERPPSHRTAV